MSRCKKEYIIINKKLLMYGVFSVFAALCFAGSIEGLWKSMEKNGTITGVWKFYIKDDCLYGICLASMTEPIDNVLSLCKDRYPSHPVVSGFNTLLRRETPLIYGLQNTGGGIWKGGYIIDARNGKRWNCDIIFHLADDKNFKNDTLEMKGGLGLIKVSQFWQAISVKEANTLILTVIEKNGSDSARRSPEQFFIMDK